MKLPQASPPALHAIVSKLEANGHTLEMQHHPRSWGVVPGTDDLVYRGLSQVSLRVKAGVTISAVSYCSVQDVFCKATGAAVALRKVLRLLHQAFGRDYVKTILSR